MTIQDIQALSSIITWPITTLIIAFLLKSNITVIINKITQSNSIKAKIGDLEIEIEQLAEKGSKAISSFNELNFTLASSRLFEMEITYTRLQPTLTKEEQIKFEGFIKKLKLELGENK